jgi:type I restriction enzyme, S subunit
VTTFCEFIKFLNKKVKQDLGLLLMTTQKIPKDWAEYQIGDFAIVNPQQLSSKTSNDRSFFYIDLSMVNEGKITEPDRSIPFSQAPSRARRLLEKGDVIMSMVRPNLCGHGRIVKDVSNWVCSTGFAQQVLLYCALR